MTERKRLLAEVPASTLGPGVGYLAEHAARWLGRQTRGTVWLDLGVVDAADSRVQHQLANADQFREYLRLELGVVVHAFQLVPELGADLWQAISDGGFDLSPCLHCGKPVVCIPDGLPMCEVCAENSAR